MKRAIKKITVKFGHNVRANRTKRSNTDERDGQFIRWNVRKQRLQKHFQQINKVSDFDELRAEGPPFFKDREKAQQKQRDNELRRDFSARPNEMGNGFKAIVNINTNEKE